MAVVAPFKGVLYNVDRVADLERIVTPPYDVISESEQEEYYKRDPYNVVRLTLGKKKIGDTDWDNRYTRAADLFKRWESENIFIRSQVPSLYLVAIEYQTPDKAEKRTRWGFIALLRIEENDSSVILPHEKTFTFHREDRTKLLRACSVQFSPVFGLYEDESNAILMEFGKVKDSPPLISFRARGGYSYKMWEVANASIVNNVASQMSSKTIVIADGHHRYESARNFRNLMRARYGSRGLGCPYEYVMMYLTNLTDKGLTILPSHRLFKSYPGFKEPQFLSAVSRWFDILPFPFSNNDHREVQRTFLDQLEGYGRHTTAIGFYLSGSRSYYLLHLKSGARDALGDDLHPSLKQLDVLALSRLIFQRTLGIKREDLDDERIIQYESNTGAALSSVLSGDNQIVFLVNPTRMEQVMEVTGNSLLMPRKSTYFYPKILTGLVLNKINPKEEIQVPGQG